MFTVFPLYFSSFRKKLCVILPDQDNNEEDEKDQEKTKETVPVHDVSFLLSFKATRASYQNVTSPYSSNTVPSELLMRIKKPSTTGYCIDEPANSRNCYKRKCMMII